MHRFPPIPLAAGAPVDAGNALGNRGQMGNRGHTPFYFQARALARPDQAGAFM